ncbi:MAG: hypothetical protein ACTJHU_08760, partial [Mycetocola sp.]
PAMPDMSGMFKIMSFLPFLTAVIAAFIPLAAGIYMLTTTTWTLGERLILRRIYPPLPPEELPQASDDSAPEGGAAERRGD